MIDIIRQELAIKVSFEYRKLNVVQEYLRVQIAQKVYAAYIFVFLHFLCIFPVLF